MQGLDTQNILILTLDFPRQNFLLIRVIWWMVYCTALPTLNKVSPRWRQLFCPLPLLRFDYGSEMRDAFFHERWERRRIQLFLCAQFHRGLYKQILWTFSILSSVINLIPQLWRRWTYILETYSSPGERCTFFLLSHAHVIGYSRLSGRVGRCCVEMHYGTVSEDAITSFIGYYKVARANWSERVPCTSPTMQKI